ncbi:MAG: GntR family transcriptional regulator [Planctomycetaceae bacterium]|nr:GntR family transcriptional regulator [Planctomycetaceae bacterium]
MARPAASARSPRPRGETRGETREKSGHRRLGLSSEKVYQALRQQIVSGELPPGTRLSHRSIATSMGTSNGPVVGALRRLAHDGLITYEPSGGGMIKQFTDEELADAMILRRALETEAARLVARRAAPEDIEQLHAIVNRMGELVKREAWREADEADIELHIAIAQLTRSAGLMEALERCHLRELVRRRILVRDRQRDIQCLEQNHRRLVDAIASHDPDLAGRTMHEHLSPHKS